jgi:signal transduction histidine kinase
LTEAHGGRLAYVEQSKGTRFEVILPASALVS